MHHTLTPLHTYTDLHLHTENMIASFVISVEPAWFCRRRARCTDHCGVMRGKRHEASPTTVSCTKKNSRTQRRRRSTRQRRREKPGVLYSTNATPTLSSERRRETTPHAATGPEGNLTTRTDDSKTKNREPKARSNCQHRRTAPQKTPQDLNAAAASPAVTKEEKVQRSHQPTKAATQTKQPWPFSKKK